MKEQDKRRGCIKDGLVQGAVRDELDVSGGGGDSLM